MAELSIYERREVDPDALSPAEEIRLCRMMAWEGTEEEQEQRARLMREVGK